MATMLDRRGDAAHRVVNDHASGLVATCASPGLEHPKIQDYAVIGDGRSIALVSRTGSIDWLCWPRFESPAIFARLLDLDRGGSWRITPTAPVRIARRYVAHTNVLETVFENADGCCVLSDAMTI